MSGGTPLLTTVKQALKCVTFPYAENWWAPCPSFPPEIPTHISGGGMSLFFPGKKETSTSGQDRVPRTRFYLSAINNRKLDKAHKTKCIQNVFQTPGHGQRRTVLLQRRKTKHEPLDCSLTGWRQVQAAAQGEESSLVQWGRPRWALGMLRWVGFLRPDTGEKRGAERGVGSAAGSLWAFGRVPSGPHEKKPPGAGERSPRVNSSQAHMELATVCLFTSPNGKTSDHTSRGTKLALD